MIIDQDGRNLITQLHAFKRRKLLLTNPKAQKHVKTWWEKRKTMRKEKLESLLVTNASSHNSLFDQVGATSRNGIPLLKQDLQNTSSNLWIVWANDRRNYEF